MLEVGSIDGYEKQKSSFSRNQVDVVSSAALHRRRSTVTGPKERQTLHSHLRFQDRLVRKPGRHEVWSVVRFHFTTIENASKRGTLETCCSLMTCRVGRLKWIASD